jgi:hypothetical protein
MRKWLVAPALVAVLLTLGGCWWGPYPYRHHGGGGGYRDGGGYRHDDRGRY